MMNTWNGPNITIPLIILGFCIALVGYEILEQTVEVANTPPTAEINIVEDTTENHFVLMQNMPRKFDKVPAGKHVYRSNQPTVKQIQDILENYPIETVIRMNDTEGTGVNITDEQNAVEAMGKKFVWINAHLGFEEGKGYVESLKQIQPYLDKGNVLIHCAAGKDRTGYQVAKFIQRKEGWSKEKLWEYTIKYNDWETIICQGKRGYIKYMEAFFPYEEWKAKNYCK